MGWQLARALLRECVWGVMRGALAALEALAAFFPMEAAFPLWVLRCQCDVAAQRNHSLWVLVDDLDRFLCLEDGDGVEQAGANRNVVHCADWWK